MIGPKQSKPTAAEEREAYDTATSRDEGRCTRCGRSGDMHRDHRQNRMAGNTVVSNLALLCAPNLIDAGCHLWKTENPGQAIEDGYAVPRWGRPEAWPARRHDARGWILYLDTPTDTGKWWMDITDATADLLMRGYAR